MRVCHVAYTYFPFDPRVRKEVLALQAAGHEVDVVVMCDAGEPAEDTVQGVSVHRVLFPILRGGPLRYLFQYLVFFLAATAIVAKLHRRRQFEVIHVHSLPDFQVFCALPERVLGTPVILDLHEAMPEIFVARMGLSEDGIFHGIVRTLEWMSCAIADRVVVVNEAIAKLLAARGVDQRKISIVFNSPDIDVEGLQEGTNAEPGVGTPEGATLVYAGGINPERDLVSLVHAARLLAESRPVSLFLVGRGPEAYRQRLQSVAQGAPAGFQLQISEWVPPRQALRYMTLSDVGVVPYVRNPITRLALPNKVFEYAAARRPMVLADLPTLRSVWEGAALFYEPGDSRTLAESIRRLLDDRQLRAQLLAAADQVYERCRWERSRGVLLDIYRGLTVLAR